MVCVGVVESLSAAERRLFGPTTTPPPPPNSLSNARARAHSVRLKRANYGVRAITGRSRRSARSFVGLPYASSEMRPNLFAFYRAPSLQEREKGS